ncbi:hypothetical protein CEXT_81441 [Caerostris extrusa]|uniref:Uncharacterized protein n=1 Tax=Caerostris extrusa TaxID=172846 RepID=A0AAV4RNC5_CAEEX|nr:hypothetical protein CEXT_81441 [Caerostris extrusa]
MKGYRGSLIARVQHLKFKTILLGSSSKGSSEDNYFGKSNFLRIVRESAIVENCFLHSTVEDLRLSNLPVTLTVTTRRLITSPGMFAMGPVYSYFPVSSLSTDVTMSVVTG